MTIPEAAQLVIQAGSMATGGDVFVLDMGKPVKILDLAHRMINLMGMTVRDAEHPDGDIEIEFVGLRPAEKLFEELLIGSNVSGTGHPRIMRADEDCLTMEALSELLDQLIQASQDLDYEKARKVLLTAVKEYDPQNGIDDLIWAQKDGGEPPESSTPTSLIFRESDTTRTGSNRSPPYRYRLYNLQLDTRICASSAASLIAELGPLSDIEFFRSTIA